MGLAAPVGCLSGPSLPTLDPRLNPALPDTPRYKAHGQLTRTGDVYFRCESHAPG